MGEFESRPLSVLCPVIFIATDHATPARSRFRTAVRRKSWSSRPGTPASLHTVSQRLENPRRAWPARRPFACGNRYGTMRPNLRCRASDTLYLACQQPLEFLSEVHGAPLSVLRGPGVEAQHSGFEVELAPLKTSASQRYRRWRRPRADHPAAGGAPLRTGEPRRTLPVPAPPLRGRSVERGGACRSYRRAEAFA
jgi:hypothetical protein